MKSPRFQKFKLSQAFFGFEVEINIPPRRVFYVLHDAIFNSFILSDIHQPIRQYNIQGDFFHITVATQTKIKNN